MEFLRKLAGKARTARHLALLMVRPPAYRRRISRLISVALPKGTCDSKSVTLADQLQKDGFIMLENVFSLDRLRKVRVALEQKECVDPWHPERGRFSLEHAPETANNAHIVDVETIPETVSIANDPAVIGIVTSYFGCKPTIDDILAWWSFPGRAEPREEQFFHRDQDSIRFLKLFIYLSDVTDADGPHIFVRGSHFSNILLNAGKRFTDNEVLANADPRNIVRFTGAFGTCFLEDTFGLHKGEMPESGTRLILQVRYTMLPSMFAQPGSKKAVASSYDSYINRLIRASQATSTAE